MKNYLLTPNAALILAFSAFFSSWVFYFLNKNSADLIGGMHFAVLAYIAAAILKK